MIDQSLVVIASLFPSDSVQRGIPISDTISESVTVHVTSQQKGYYRYLVYIHPYGITRHSRCTALTQRHDKL
jgi:hypothetical protein